ncbi:hypothetical protein BJ170DRAFT_641804 [Xylariales sp. AK1849]|nr:hypothetical protein BJ170DRAFT_641804 [Xylariales sp. AK1849]
MQPIVSCVCLTGALATNVVIEIWAPMSLVTNHMVSFQPQERPPRCSWSSSPRICRGSRLETPIVPNCELRQPC